MGISSPRHLGVRSTVHRRGGFFFKFDGSRSAAKSAMIISVVMRSRIAKQVIHKGAGPKLPYQAVVIRQSAVHRKGRNAIVSQGGVARHAGSGPVPVFIGFWM